MVGGGGVGRSRAGRPVSISPQPDNFWTKAFLTLSPRTPQAVLTEGNPVTPEKPILFLDVDGVLNRYGEDFPRARPEGGRGAQLHIPEDTAERMQRLLEVFDPIWATAWRRGAHRVFAPLLGLPSRPWHCVDYRDFKLPHLIRYAGERRWAWVDDDAEWELEQTGIEPSGLVIAPDTAVGLTDEHVEELLVFAKSEVVATVVRQGV